MFWGYTGKLGMGLFANWEAGNGNFINWELGIQHMAKLTGNWENGSLTWKINVISQNFGTTRHNFDTFC